MYYIIEFERWEWFVKNDKYKIKKVGYFDFVHKDSQNWCLNRGDYDAKYLRKF
jgi:hypothetical protein